MSYQRLDDDVAPTGRPPPYGAGKSRELFDEDSAQQSAHGDGARPWWKTNFFIRGPVLFGTWDGVFTTVMINIFGVLIFLRMGWMIGYAGVGVASVIILATIFLGALTIMSVIGVITRHVRHTEMHRSSGAGDSMATYDVFSMIGFVLGERISGSVGMVYAFGHAVAVAMYAVGLGEAMGELFHWHGEWRARGVALGTTFILLLVVLAGVRWVVKLQLVLMAVLIVAILDFMVGTLVRRSPAYGVLGYSASLLHNNTAPAFTGAVTFFNVFGVFFPTMTGVAGGLNMACDLRTPARSVPVGTTAALLVSGVSWIVMAVMLGATCSRPALQADTLIEYRVSLVGALFLIGLYVSSLSSCLAVFYGAPRVLQAMGRAKIVPLLSVIGVGRGPNKEPVVAILVVGAIAFVFVFVGHLNTLAVLINMPFLLTYSVLNYAYFSLAQSDDGVACVPGERRPLNRMGSLYRGASVGSGDGDDATADNAGTDDDDDVVMIDAEQSTTPSAGGVGGGGAFKSTVIGGGRGGGPVVRFTESDLLLEKAPGFGAGDESSASSLRHRSVGDGAAGKTSPEPWPSRYPRLRRLQARLRMTSPERTRREESVVRGLQRLVSRWMALAGCFLCLIAMFVINWGFALAAVCCVLILFIYIGHANPGLHVGESSFSLALWLPQLARRLQARCRPADSAVDDTLHASSAAASSSSSSSASAFPTVSRTSPQQPVIVTTATVPFDMSVVQLTSESRDYSRRERVHHSVRQNRPADEFSATRPAP